MERDLVSRGALIERFREAVEGYLLDARAVDLPKYVAKLHQLERDLLGAAETAIELPSWLDSRRRRRLPRDVESGPDAPAAKRTSNAVA